MKPLAEHGTTARAKGRPASGIPGCPCQPCRRAENAYDKRRRLLAATGRTLTVDAAPVTRHLNALFDAGAGWVQLAAITGCSHSTLSVLRRHQLKKIRRSTANAILAVRIGDARPARRLIPATGAKRRAQALIAAGHTSKTICNTAAVDHSALSDLVNGRLTTVTADLAARITAGYDVLRAQPGSNTRAINRGCREGWPDPQWWEDFGRIDDPAFDPATAEPDESPRYVALAEDWLDLERQGYDRRTAAERLGVTREYLQASITRYQRQYEEAA